MFTRLSPLAAATTLLMSVLTVGSVAAFGAPPSPSELQQQLERQKLKTNLYRVYLPDAKTLRKAAISFEAQLHEARYADGYLVLELTNDDMDKLRPFGARFETAAEATRKRDALITRMQQLHSSGAAAKALAVGTIPDFPCYETVEGTFAVMQDFVDKHPDLASLTDIGKSWQRTQKADTGYPLRVLRLTNSATDRLHPPAGPKPKLFVQSAMHARELQTAPTVLEFARWLVNGHGVNADATWLLDHHEIHLLLHVNPDGRKHAETGVLWRKNVNDNFCADTDYRGVDLNRNFSFSWNSTGGRGSSGEECHEDFRGTSAGSEPEVQAVQTYVRSLWPDRRGPLATDAAPSDTSGIHLDIHSFSQLVLWPWGSTDAPSPNATAFQTLGRRLAYFNGYYPTQSIGLYPTDGTSSDVSYGELGVAALTIELGDWFFETCEHYLAETRPTNLPALIYAAKVVRTPYLTPAGPDVDTPALSDGASGAGVARGTSVRLTATATDTHFSQDNGSEPIHAIAAAEYYIDRPPWQEGSHAIALGAVDGRFGSPTEAIGGTINTHPLKPGAHIVYVRAQGDEGTWGPISAVFLKIADRK